MIVPDISRSLKIDRLVCLIECAQLFLVSRGQSGPSVSGHVAGIFSCFFPAQFCRNLLFMLQNNSMEYVRTREGSG